MFKNFKFILDSDQMKSTEYEFETPRQVEAYLLSEGVNDEITDLHRPFNEFLSETFYQYALDEGDYLSVYQIAHTQRGVFRVLKERYFKRSAEYAIYTYDLDLFIETSQYLWESVIPLAFKKGALEIVQYIVANIPLKKSPLWYCIDYDAAFLLRSLIKESISIDADWMAFCIYKDGVNCMITLLDYCEQRNIDIAQYKSSWFYKVRNECVDNNTLKYLSIHKPEWLN